MAGQNKIAASGSRLIAGFRRERSGCFGVPDPTQPVIYYKGVLPAALGLVRPEAPSGQVNASGFEEKGLPGPVTGPLDFALLVVASQMLEHYENLFQGGSKAVLEANRVREYTFTPDPNGFETSFSVVAATPPVDRWWLYGVKNNSITYDIANNAPIPARFALIAAHGTRVGEAIPDGSNTGSYTVGPAIRGVLHHKVFGDIWVEITRDVVGGGIRFQVEQSTIAPTFPSGTEYDISMDEVLQGRWQSLQGDQKISGLVTIGAGTPNIAGDSDTRFLSELEVGKNLHANGETGIIATITDDQTAMFEANHVAGAAGVVAHRLGMDLGLHGENRDPLDLIIPGTDATELADLDIGDLFQFPISWNDPVPTFLSGQRYTSAHWIPEYQAPGSSVWVPLNALTGQVILSWPLSVDQGAASKYANALDRDTTSSFTLSLPRKFRDIVFQEFKEVHERFGFRMRLDGKQIGSGVPSFFRESEIHTMPNVGLVSADNPASDVNSITETIAAKAETDDLGTPPLTIVVTTERDFDFQT